MLVIKVPIIAERHLMRNGEKILMLIVEHIAKNDFSLIIMYK